MPCLPAQAFVSVVIPHQGDDSFLLRCLEALRNQTYPSHLYEVLVVLNEPERSYLEFELQEGEFPLWEPRYFSYNARDRGIEASGGDVIAFTDSDTVPHPDWLSQGTLAMARSGSDLIAGHISVTTSTNRPSPPELYELLYAFDQEKNVSGGYSATANLFARRHLFADLGLFEETAITGEDFDWTRSAVEAGATLIYSADAIVEHPARDTWSTLFAKARRTTLPYVDIAEPGSSQGNHLRERVRFQLRATPSPGKANALSKSQRFVARFMRLLLIAYKALCLLRIPPAFKRNLQAIRGRQVAVVPAIQEATT